MYSASKAKGLPSSPCRTISCNARTTPQPQVVAPVISELLPEGLLKRNETMDHRIARLCSNIEGLYREETSIRRMVKISDMGSKSTLMRNFRKATGTTPHQFLIKSKYAYGAELLTTTQYTIGEICEMIGVNNQFLFSRVFKKIYGVPPSRYRKID